MKPLRIRIVQDLLRSGGTERQTILLARAFEADGHDVAVITFRPGGTLADTLAPVPRVTLQPFDTGLNWFAPGLLRTLRRAAPDVVLLMGRMAHVHGWRVVSALPALPAVRVVATLRTGKPLPWGYRRTLARAAHVVANSAESARRLTGSEGVPASRVSVIHNALVFPPGPVAAPCADSSPAASLSAPSTPSAPTAPSAPAARDLRAQLGAGPASVVLLCVGMLRPEKNQRALIEAAALLPPSPDWRLWFVGEGPARAACAALAARLGVAERVRFLGFQADPRPLYAAADVAVLASRAESLSNFLIEAQAHGLPVVAARATGVDECFRDGVSGTLVAPDDPAAFAAALLPYLADPARRAAAGAAGAAHARAAFAPAAQARAYLALFARLLATRANDADAADTDEADDDGRPKARD